MSPNTKPDFSNYDWTPGAFDGDGICIRTDPSRVSLGVRGYDRKHGRAGFILATLTPEAIDALVAKLAAAKANLAPTATPAA